jgi:hypothetical protein
MRAFLPVCLGLVVFLPGCASVSVDRMSQNSGVTPIAPPRGIFVAPFSAPPEVFALGGRSVAEFEQTRARIGAELQKRIVGQIARYAGPAYALYSSAQVQPGSWVVAGMFTKVDQGSRALRAGIGFGAGESNVTTTVGVYAVAGGQLVPLLAFDTRGGSGKMPGVVFSAATAITPVGAASLAAQAAGGLMPGLTDDLDRTAYEVAAVLSDYLARHKLLDASRQAIQPKLRGKIPARVNPERAIPAPLRPSTKP